MANRVISAVLTLRDRNFSSGLTNAANNLSDFDRGVLRVGGQINRFGQSATRSIGGVAKSALGLAATAVGLTGFGASLATIVSDMDTAFSRLEAKTGTTGAELEGLKGTVKDVFKAGFGESIGQVSNDMSILNNTFKDFSDQQLTNLGKSIYTVTELWGQDFNEVSRTVSVMQKNFKGLSETDAMDALTYGFQNGLDFSGEFLDTLREYSPQFSEMGMSMENTMAVLKAGTDAGAWNLDKVGDAIKESHLRMGALDKATVDAYKSMGFKAEEYVSKISKGGPEGNKAFQEIVGALMKVEDATKRNELSTALFGTQYEDLREEVIFSMAEATTATLDFEGATKKAADAMHNNFGSRMDKVWRNVKLGISEAFKENGGQELLSEIATKAESLVPVFSNIVAGAVDFANEVKNNWPQIKETLITIGSAVATFAAGMAVLKVISTVTALIQGFRAALTLATAGQWAMNTAMLASPLTWVVVGIAAVVAAGVLLYRNWDVVSAKAGELWAKVKEVFGSIYDWGKEKIQGVSNFFGGLVDKVKDFISRITSFKPPEWLSKIGGAIGNAANKVKGFINGSHATGLNRVPYNGYIAELHKDEMVIPARQSERLRQQGATIDNIDNLTVNGKQQSSPSVPTVNKTTNNNSNGVTIVIENLNAKGVTAAEVVNELVPILKTRMANI